MKEIYALGVGHGTPLFIELAEACGYKVVGLYHYNDERTGEFVHGYPILGSFSELYNEGIIAKNFVLTMGDMNIKKNVSQIILNFGGNIPTLVHPSAIISKFSNISDCGVLICSHCEIHNDTEIEEGCVMWPQAIVGHDCVIKKYVFIGPKAYIGAYTEVNERAFIGQCSVLISAKVNHVGFNTLVGAGALVTKPLPDNVVAIGSPARVIKQRSE